MGSKRFYEHAQNMLGGVKGSGHYLNLGGSWDYFIGVLEFFFSTPSDLMKSPQ